MIKLNLFVLLLLCFFFFVGTSKVVPLPNASEVTHVDGAASQIYTVAPASTKSTSQIDGGKDGKTDYSNRASDIGQMKGNIANGNFELTASKADNTIQQKVSVGISGLSLPAELKALLGKVEEEMVDYPNRESDIRQMKGYIANGNFDLASFKAKNIIKQQDNLINATKNGLPAELKALLGQVEEGMVDYPNRASDIRQMKGYIANGNFDLAAFKAKNIVKQQSNLR